MNGLTVPDQLYEVQIDRTSKNNEKNTEIGRGVSFVTVVCADFKILLLFGGFSSFFYFFFCSMYNVQRIWKTQCSVYIRCNTRWWILHNSFFSFSSFCQDIRYMCRCNQLQLGGYFMYRVSRAFHHTISK